MDVTQLFLTHSTHRPEFTEAIDIVRKNTAGGRIWLIGGFVFKTLAAAIYNLTMPEVDVDFIVENPGLGVKVPENWEVSRNRFGSQKLRGPQYEIDIVPLHAIHALVSRNAAPTIENFLLYTPLTIQSIAYDVLEQNILGDVGLKALAEKTVSVQCTEALLHVCQLSSVSAEEYIENKAGYLGFQYKER